MGRFNLLPTYSVALASVAFCAWMFFTSMSTLRKHRNDEWHYVPAGTDALTDMSWAEIVRTMGLCEKQRLRVFFVAPKETPGR